MLAKFFIERPIFAWVISIVILLLGAVSYKSLSISQYPDITPPSVQVTASYPGANAQTVADSVAAPIEQQVNGVERMLYMSSQCTNDGNYTLTVTFELGTDLNMAQVLVQNRVALAMAQLPEQVQVQGVNTNKQSPSILLAVNLFSPTGKFDSLYLSNYATIYIQDELLRIDGVGNINYLGQREYSMRIWLDPEKMANRGIATSDVINAIRNQNVQVAAGTIGRPPVPAGQQFQLTINAKGRLLTEEEFSNIIVKTSQGEKSTEKSPSTQVVRVKDVARVDLGSQTYDQICQLDGQPSVALAIFQLPGSNALNVADQIKKTMAELSKSFPQGLEYAIVYDTTPFINESIHEVIKTLRDAVILVAIVVLFFLQDWKAMILPMIDVPVSLVGTFAVMAVMGFNLNNLTLFGLVLAIGIVVDDAIVVLENVERWIAKGYEPKEATIRAMGEITGTIVAVTLVLISVFLPTAFITGIPGQFFRQFALTISAAMVISAINAMTLTPSRAVSVFKTEKKADGSHEHVREALPWWIFGLLGFVSLSYGLEIAERLVANMMGISVAEEQSKALLSIWPTVLAFMPGLVLGLILGWFIIKPVNAVLGVIFKGFNKIFDKITDAYGWTVGRSLRLSAIVLLAYCGLLAATAFGMMKSPTGFIPEQDQGYLLVNVLLPDSASVERTEAVMAKVDELAKSIPGVAHRLSVAGQSILLQANGSNFGSMFVILDDFDKRTSHAEYDAVIAQKLNALCAEQIDEALVNVFRAPPIQGLGNASGFQLQIEQKGYVDLKDLQAAADDLCRDANTLPGQPLLGVLTMFRAETPQLYVDIDRTKCESLMVPVQDVFNTLQTYLGSYYVNQFNAFGRTWQVNLLAEDAYRVTPDTLGLLKARNKLGQMVPLSTLCTVKDTGGPVMYMRYNMYPSASINGMPAPGTSSGQAITMMEQLCQKLGIPYEWTTIYYLQIQAGSSGLMVFGLATVLVFLVLAAKYESWKLPMSVILVVPMCLLSATVGMFLAQLPLDIFVQIGFVVLIAMAAKNAILIVEFAEQQRAAGLPLYEATKEACHLRLRPIIMTSFAFILGVVPLIIGHGAGAEMRRSLGMAVFSGMIGVTIFGLFLTPVFYYAMMYRSEKRRLAAKAAENRSQK